MAWISAVSVNTANFVSGEMASHNKLIYFNPESRKTNKQTNIVRLCYVVVVLHVKYFTILYKSLDLPAQGKLLNKLLDSGFLKELLLGHGAVIKCAVLPQAWKQLHIGNCNPTHVVAGLSEITPFDANLEDKDECIFDFFFMFTSFILLLFSFCWIYFSCW